LYCFERVAQDGTAAPKQKKAKPPKAHKAPSAAPGRTVRVVHWALLFVASLIVLDGLVGERGLLAMLRARHQYDELSATIARQRAENARLREEARRLKEDPNAIEEIARRDLGLIKPGEKVFIVKDVAPAKP
jgi:cell division protein FtsB